MRRKRDKNGELYRKIWFNGEGDEYLSAEFKEFITYLTKQEVPFASWCLDYNDRIIYEVNIPLIYYADMVYTKGKSLEENYKSFQEQWKARIYYEYEHNKYFRSFAERNN